MSAGAAPQPEPFQRMARTVLQIVRADARVQELDPPLRLSAHTRAIWVDVGPMDAQVTFRIEELDWWAPLKTTRARELAERLVVVCSPARRTATASRRTDEGLTVSCS
jgi:hypothetical protein